MSFANVIQSVDFCLITTIYYIKKDTLETWNGMIVVKEQIVILFPPHIVSSLFQKKMDTLYCAATRPLLIYSGDVSFVGDLPCVI